MRPVVVVLGCVLASGCGEVSNKPKPDAATTVDMAEGVDAAVDAPPDSAIPAVASAVFAQGISAFAAPNATFTKVQYSAEVYDAESEYDPTTQRYTAKQAGDYLVCAALTLTPDVYFELDLYKNSTRLRPFVHMKYAGTGCTTVRLAANDYIEVWLYQDSGGTVNVSNHAQFDSLSIHKIQPSVLAGTSAVFNVANTTFTRVPYNVESIDDGNQYDNANQRFVAAQATDAFVCSSLHLGNATYNAELDIYKNGVRENGFAHGVAAARGCRTVRLAATNSVETWIHHSLGSTMSVTHNSLWNWTTIHAQPASVSLDSVGTFSYNSGVFTKVLYTGEDYDTNGEFDVGTSTFTASAAGDYLVCAAFDHRVGLTHYVELDTFKNGNRYSGLAFGYGATTGCGVVRLAANDQLDVRVYQGTGSTLTSQSDGIWYWLQISKIR